MDPVKKKYIYGPRLQEALLEEAENKHLAIKEK